MTDVQEEGDTAVVRVVRDVGTAADDWNAFKTWQRYGECNANVCANPEEAARCEKGRDVDVALRLRHVPGRKDSGNVGSDIDVLEVPECLRVVETNGGGVSKRHPKSDTGLSHLVDKQLLISFIRRESNSAVAAVARLNEEAFRCFVGQAVNDPNPLSASGVKSGSTNWQKTDDRIASERNELHVAQVPSQSDNTAAIDSQVSGREPDPDGIAVILHAKDVTRQVKNFQFSTAVWIYSRVDDDSENQNKLFVKFDQKRIGLLQLIEYNRNTIKKKVIRLTNNLYKIEILYITTKCLDILQESFNRVIDMK